MRRALVIVVSYNNKDLTERAVNALAGQTVPVKTVVWDNASSDGTREWLLSREDVTSHLSDANILWTPAVNRAIQYYWSGEKYVGWMNNDAAPTAQCVERMLNLLRRPEVGLVSPSMERIGGPQDVANCEGKNKIRPGAHPDRVLAGLPPKRATFVLGAFAMTKKSVWDEVGPQDETMPLGADDHDYCIRVKRAGHQIWVAQDAFAYHAGHASSRVKGGQVLWDKHGAESWDSFNKKWDGYYADDAEADKCHWGGVYHEGFDK